MSDKEEIWGVEGYSRAIQDIFPPFQMEGLKVEIFEIPVGDVHWFRKTKDFRAYDGKDWIPLEWTFSLRRRALKEKFQQSRVYLRFLRAKWKLKNLRHLRLTCSPKHECDCW
jgi:hypothetical protein